MRPLVLYYSFSGNNELLAKALAARLDCPVEGIVEKKRRRPITILLDLALKRRPAIEEIRASPAEHDHVVFIAPLWNRRIAHPMASAIRRVGSTLPDYSFVTLCGGERPGQREHVLMELEDLAGKPPANAWELHVEDLQNAAAKPAGVTGHRVTPRELTHFTGVIEEIAGALRPSEAGSTPSRPDAA